MDIRFHGGHNTDEAIESVCSIFRLFRERYGITDFSAMNLRVTLHNTVGEEVELVDSETTEVLGLFEVHKTSRNKSKLKGNKLPKIPKHKGHLKLIVDNTCSRK